MRRFVLPVPLVLLFIAAVNGVVYGIAYLQNYYLAG